MSLKHGLNLLSLDGFRALITGAGSGLGRQMSLGLAEAGADLVLCGRRQDALKETAMAVEELGAKAEVIPCDITDSQSVARLRSQAGRVDILVNNAGVSTLHGWRDVTHEQWNTMLQLNLYAPFQLCQVFAPAMVDRGWGRIINVSSIYGSVGGNPALYPDVDWDYPAYFASKHGVHGITHHLAVQLAAYGVCVNSLSPGMFETEANKSRLTPSVRRALVGATPASRLGRSDDLKAAVVFLASPGASFVVGQNLIVDGGWTVW
jgi:NAD(P)-dependent dehydrogenase (short-subunit alcohol dehydrogenase family)